MQLQFMEIDLKVEQIHAAKVLPTVINEIRNHKKFYAIFDWIFKQPCSFLIDVRLMENSAGSCQ